MTERLPGACARALSRGKEAARESGGRGRAARRGTPPAPPLAHPLAPTAAASSITPAHRASLASLAEASLGAPLAPGVVDALVDLLGSGCAPGSVSAVLGAVCRGASAGR